MEKNVSIEPCYYPNYLQLDKLLDAQYPMSKKYGNEAHDEMLFIIIHQAYELWFKQILHEIYSVKKVLEKPELDAMDLDFCLNRFQRMCTIQKVINNQIEIIETMTPQSFLEFRNYLVPASGFQSWQFREIEIRLGLKESKRINFDKQSFSLRLEKKEQEYLKQVSSEKSIYELVGNWLERIPFIQTKEFNFWKEYEKQTQIMLLNDQNIIRNNKSINEEERARQLEQLELTRKSFDIILNKEKFEELREKNQFDLSHTAVLSALFIKLYHKYPVLNLPFRLIESIIQYDELVSSWRYSHFLMVHRMLGKKIGTGGSSGHKYLLSTTKSNRIFNDLYNLSTFLIPESMLPVLPENLAQNLTYKS